jgi:hypothetical protein
MIRKLNLTSDKNDIKCGRYVKNFFGVRVIIIIIIIIIITFNYPNKG